MSEDLDVARACSYALRLANRKYDATMIADALMRTPELTAVLSQGGHQKATKKATGIARWAVGFAADHPVDAWKAEVLANLMHWREVADTVPWSGKGGPTQRRVLEAFYLTGTIARSDKFRLAARTIGRRAGIPWRTANFATRRLIDLGMVRPVGNYGENLGTKYQLAAPRSWSSFQNHASQNPNTRFLHNGTVGGDYPLVQENGIQARSPDDGLARYALSHDAFSENLLGSAGWMVIYWLDPFDALTPRELSVATGMSYERVRKVLGKLHAYRLAHPASEGWVRASDMALVARLDALAIDPDEDTLPLVQENGPSAPNVASLERAVIDLAVRERDREVMW